MSAGELRFLVDIKRPATDAVVAGDYSGLTFTRHCQTWANIQYSAGKETGSARDSTLGQAKIKIRYRNDITNKMRVYYDGREFEIQDTFDLTGKRKYLMMLVKVVNK
jgi:SPP1 family predicted phage head-tail adaptor